MFCVIGTINSGRKFAKRNRPEVLPVSLTLGCSSRNWHLHRVLMIERMCLPAGRLKLARASHQQKGSQSTTFTRNKIKIPRSMSLSFLRCVTGGRLPRVFLCQSRRWLWRVYARRLVGLARLMGDYEVGAIMSCMRPISVTSSMTSACGKPSMRKQMSSPLGL